VNDGRLWKETSALAHNRHDARPPLRCHQARKLDNSNNSNTTQRPQNSKLLNPLLCIHIPCPVAALTMDYSAVGAEEHPGSSPWASSPQHNRTSFGEASGNDVPSSPLPSNTSFSNQEHGEAEEQSYGSNAGIAENGEGSHPPAVAEAQDSPPQQEHASPQQQPQQHHSHQSAQRYRAQGSRNRQPPPPAQNKLQAKVTGLERSGRKDPILRFDVYVSRSSILSVYLSILTDIRDRPTSPSSEPRNSVTYDAPMASSSSLPST
jgi:hypothetical protein